MSQLANYSPFFLHYIISPNEVGPKWRKFSKMKKIWADANLGQLCLADKVI